MKIDKQILILTILSLIFFLPFFAKPELLTSRDNDLGRTYIPLFSFIKNSFYQFNQIPLWRPSQMMGETLIGNPLSSLTYPLNLIFLFIPTKFASMLYFFLHLLVASFSTYILARSLNFSK